MVFEPVGAGGNRFRAVPDRFVSFPDFTLTAAQWDALQIPVGVAFFFVNSAIEQIAAFYPSPAGATESLLPLDSWNEIVTANPELTTLRPDVEAFLVRSAERRSGTVQADGQPAGQADGQPAGQPECFLVPIDVCYELVGELRKLWKGFDGGAEAHARARRRSSIAFEPGHGLPQPTTGSVR